MDNRVGSGAESLVTAVDVPADVGQIGAVRRHVRDVLVSAGCDGRVDDALLVLSELLANAVAHAKSGAAVQVFLDGAIARIEVTDRDPTIPVRTEPAPDASSGRGLLIVDALASDWGFRRDGDGGKTAWAIIEC